MRGLILAGLVAASPALANEAEDAFVEANLIAIFYHEIGHAVIDVMELPVFGQEEDAADVASILLIDAVFDEAAAADIAYDAAFGFLGEAELSDGDIAWWDVHGPDEQRFYNLVCLFYGADPDARDDIAEDLGLPEDRAEYCPEEFELANDSWGPVWDEMADLDHGHALSVAGPTEGLLPDTVRAEVDAFNTHFRLPENVQVIIEPCDEANAFYDPSERKVIMCTEFEAHLRDLYRLLES